MTPNRVEVLMVVGIIVLIAAGTRLWVWLRREQREAGRRWLRRSIGFGIFTDCILVVSVSFLLGIHFWFYHRTQPRDLREEWTRGIVYQREARQLPRPIVIYSITIDLNRPGLRFFATPGDKSRGMEFRAQKTSAFITNYKLKLAINGGHFEPFYSHYFWDYYPKEGDPVNVFGLSVSEGVVASEQRAGYVTLNASKYGKVTIEAHPAEPYNAVSGRPLDLNGPWEGPDKGVPQPHTGAALDHARQRLILMVVDGRQPGYSEGVTLRELSGLLAEKGGDQGLTLDGGGSSTIASEGGVLNSPIMLGIPGRERGVGNHFGVGWER